MAAIDFRSAAPKAGFSLSSIIGAVAAWNDARKTRNALSQLSARELDDIGLNSGDIDIIADSGLIR